MRFAPLPRPLLRKSGSKTTPYLGREQASAGDYDSELKSRIHVFDRQPFHAQRFLTRGCASHQGHRATWDIELLGEKLAKLVIRAAIEWRGVNLHFDVRTQPPHNLVARSIRDDADAQVAERQRVAALRSVQRFGESSDDLFNRFRAAAKSQQVGIQMARR